MRRIYWSDSVAWHLPAAHVLLPSLLVLLPPTQLLAEFWTQHHFDDLRPG
jgi:hypothetical protein